jgi:hypothetical protein
VRVGIIAALTPGYTTLHARRLVVARSSDRSYDVLGPRDQGAASPQFTVSQVPSLDSQETASRSLMHVVADAQEIGVPS